MKTHYMQLFDQYAGQLLCFLVSLVYRTGKPPEQIKNIAVIKMFGMGSIVLMSPMIAALRKKFPGSKLYFITFRENADVIGLYRLADRVFTLRRNSLPVFIFDALATAFHLRKLKVDISIDAEFFSRFTAVMGILLGAGRKIGFYTPNLYRGNCIDQHVYFNPYRHIMRNFMELVSSLDCPEEPMVVSAPVIGAPAAESTGKKLRGAGLDPEKPLVLMNPNVSDITPSIDRSWPLENFAVVARHCASIGMQVAIIGGASQVARSSQAVQLCDGHSVSLAGMLSIEELLALMRMSYLLFTNDSGPLHMAVSVGLPTFSFFGTESPVIYGHRNGLHRTFCRELACSPCLSVFNYKRRSCEFKSRCMKEIGTGEVISAFEEMQADLDRHYQSRLSNRCR
jgi:ADP-heptose:LPS heptosyltransferase